MTDLGDSCKSLYCTAYLRLRLWRYRLCATNLETLHSFCSVIATCGSEFNRHLCYLCLLLSAEAVGEVESGGNWGVIALHRLYPS